MATSLIALAACRDVYVYPLRGGAGGAGGAGGQPPVTCPASALVGYATLGTGTTGGGAGPVMVVRTVDELKKAGLTSGPLIVRISGMLTASAPIDIGSDKTVEGEGALSGLTGAGLRVKEAHNVIFRNLVISKAAGTGDKTPSTCRPPSTCGSIIAIFPASSRQRIPTTGWSISPMRVTTLQSHGRAFTITAMPA